MTVFVSIIDFNGKENTIQCLESLSKVRKNNINLKVVIINNYPQDKFSLPEMKDLDIKIIETGKNLGFSGGHNIGIKYALENGADCVLILNNDTIVDGNLVVELVKSSSTAGIIAPKIYFAKGYEFHKDRYSKNDLGKVIWYAGGQMDWENVLAKHRGVDEVDRGQFDTVQDTNFASGCCMLVKREVFEKVGLFDNKYFLYFEDNDLCQRAKHSKFRILYNPKAILWHKNAGSAGGSGSKLQDYYITRNRLLFGMKFASFHSKISLFRESLRLLLAGRTWQKRGIIDFYTGKFGKGSYE